MKSTSTTTTLQRWETAFLAEDKPDDIPGDFLAGCELADLTPEQFAKLQDAKRLLGVDGMSADYADALDILKMANGADGADPIEIFTNPPPDEPAIWAFTKSSRTDRDPDRSSAGGVNRTRGYGWKFVVDPATGEEYVKGFKL